jgi:hypothetical protein
MARETHERENLLRDARNLEPRAQLRLRDGGRETVAFFGFRGEALSLYFDGDPVYQFNAAGELRRAFVNDVVIKADGGRLIGMRRERTAAEVKLNSAPLSRDAEQGLLIGLANKLTSLAQAIEAGRFMLDGEVPAGCDAVPRLRTWLADHPCPTPAATPRVS